MIRAFAKLITLLVVLAFPFAAAAQGQERFIEWGWLGPGAPRAAIRQPDGTFIPSKDVALDIVGILVDGKPVTLRQPFVAGDEWMRDLKVRVKNISGKPIIRATLGFSLPETKDRYANGVLAIDFRYGTAASGRAGEEEPKMVMPGEEFELTRTRQLYEIHQKFIVEQSGLTRISRLTIATASARFDDETIWLGWALLNGRQVNAR